MKLRIATALAGLFATEVSAQPDFDWQRTIDTAGRVLVAPEVAHTSISYGRSYWQEIQFWPPKNAAAPAPVVVIIVGGAEPGYTTSWMTQRLHREGFALAEVSYRVDERQNLREGMREITSAIAFLRKQSERRKIDPQRILLLGTGTGAHIAALLATDPAWLEAAGVPFASIRAVATLNGSGFDVEDTIARAPAHLRSDYRRTFGKGVAERTGLSPVDHLAPPNAPRFLFQFEEQEPRLRAQSENAAARFNAGGVSARAEALPEWHSELLSTYLLAPEGGVGESLLAFLKSSAGMPGAN
jgi:acetyl esterase/lipase